MSYTWEFDVGETISKVVQQRYLKFLNSDVEGFQLCLVFFKWDDLEDQVLYFQSVLRILLP